MTGRRTRRSVVSYRPLTDQLTVAFAADPDDALADELWTDVWVTFDRTVAAALTSVIVQSSRFARPSAWYGALTALLGRTVAGTWLELSEPFAIGAATGDSPIERTIEIPADELVALTAQWAVLDRGVRLRLGEPSPPAQLETPKFGADHVLGVPTTATAGTLELPSTVVGLGLAPMATLRSSKSRIEAVLDEIESAPQSAIQEAALLHPRFEPLCAHGGDDGRRHYRMAAHRGDEAPPTGDAVLYLGRTSAATDAQGSSARGPHRTRRSESAASTLSARNRQTLVRLLTRETAFPSSTVEAVVDDAVDEIGALYRQIEDIGGGFDPLDRADFMLDVRRRALAILATRAPQPKVR